MSVSLITGVAGTLIGIAIDLYSAEARAALETAASRTTAQVVTIAAIVFLSCGLTAFVCGRMWRTPRDAAPERHELQIQTDALDHGVPSDDAVAGRTLKYLENSRRSEELVVFLHGIGLDDEDFWPYLVEGRRHAVALTMFGFNAAERGDERYRPISLDTHVQLISYAIEHLRRKHPEKRLVLAGFSIGADLIMFLSELWSRRHAQAPEIHGVLLLDPNVNTSTANISQALAHMDPDRPMDELRMLFRGTDSLNAFRNMCEYLSKITSKNLAHIRRNAQEILDRWPDEGFDEFLGRIGMVTGITGRIRAYFSYPYADSFNSVVAAASGRGLSQGIFHCTQHEHFHLMTPTFIEEQLNELTR